MRMIGWENCNFSGKVLICKEIGAVEDIMEGEYVKSKLQNF